MKVRSFFLFLLMSLCLWSNAQTRSPKRGAGTNDMKYRKNFEVLAPGLSWFYNWSYAAPSIIQNDWETLDMEFVPMVWGHGIDQETAKTTIRQYLSKHPSVKYILGFNEPNFSSQSNIGPKRAASYWRHIEEIANEFNLQIVGPAVNFAPANGTCVEDGISYANPIQYLDTFFAACPDCRVDYLALHLYMPTGALEGTLASFAKYNRPIWLTEFNYNSGSTATAEQHMDFLTAELKQLEKNPLVFRYAWFMTYSSVRAINLLDFGEGNLTDLGKFYTQYSSFDSTFFFTPEQTIQAEHFIDFNNIKVRPDTTDDTSTLIVQNISNGSWIDYLIDTPEAGDYWLHLRIACNNKGLIQVFSDNEQLAEYIPESTGGLSSWQTISIPVKLKEGKQTLRLKSAGRMFYLNWLKVSHTQATALSLPTDTPQVIISPNPCTDVISVQSTMQVASMNLLSLNGQQLRHCIANRMNISSYRQGLYLLQITFADGTSMVKRIVKQ